MEATSREKVQTTFESASARISAAIDLFEMVRARSLDFDCEAGGACVRDLFRMNARNQATCAVRLPELAGLRNGECTSIAENIAKLGEPRHRHRGYPFLREEIYISIGPAREIPAGLHERQETWKRYQAAAPDATRTADSIFSARSSNPGRNRSSLRSLSFRRQQNSRDRPWRGVFNSFAGARRKCFTLERIPPPLSGDLFVRGA